MMLTLPSTEPSVQAQEGTAAEEPPEPESLDDLSGIFAHGSVPQAEVVPATRQASEWFVSTVNPGAALLKLPGLTLKPHYRLVSYLYRTQQDGIGLVWAVPEAFGVMAHLEKALETSGSLSKPPQPAGALKYFMEAIEGDRSPASFVIASVLRRELQEFGALGQRRTWSHHHLIDTVPAQLQWQWRADPPKDLSPKVKVSESLAIVEFFTCRSTPPLTLFRHVDQYSAAHYQPNSIDKSIAVAKP